MQPVCVALCYLRVVTRKEVKDSDICWGAVPLSGLQISMAVVVIAFPWTVTIRLDKPISAEDISKVRIVIPEMDELPPVDFNTMGKPR